MSALSNQSSKRHLIAWAFVAGLIALFILVSQLLREPLRIDYGMSWAIFGLFATLNLSYISLQNKLRDRRRGPKLSVRNQEKAEGIIFLLLWTSGFFMLTILVLGLRICLHSLCPECQRGENPIPREHPLHAVFLWLDWAIVSTFLASLFLRGAVFFYSYLDKLVKSLARLKRQVQPQQARLDGPQSAPSS